jgi:hypothetical protein
MAERVNSFIDLDDLPTLKPDPAHHKPVDPAVIEQLSKAHNFPSRIVQNPKPVEEPEPPPEPQAPDEPTSLQTLFNKPEQTKMSTFNLPVSFRSLLKEISEATGSDMTRVMLAAARPQLEQWRAEIKKRRKR